MKNLSPWLPWLLLLASATLYFLPQGSHLGCGGFGLLTVGLTYLVGKHWKGERTGLLAGTMLATSLAFFWFTRWASLDMALTFWMTLALYAVSRMLRERPGKRTNRFAGLLVAAIAGGLITHGVLAGAFPLQGLPSTGPFYFWIPILVLGFLPWSVFLPKVLRSAFEHHRVAMKRDPVLALLLLWSLWGGVGLMLPALPALALASAASLDEGLEEETMPAWMGRGVLLLVIVFVAVLGVLKLPSAGEKLHVPALLSIRARGDEAPLILGLGVFILVGVWGMRRSIFLLGGILIAQVLLLSALSAFLIN